MIDKQTMQQKIGSMLMLGFRGTSIDDTSVQEFIDDIKRFNIGGCILFGYNIVNQIQLQKLTSALRNAKKNLLIAIDQEGGQVQRLKKDKGFISTPSHKIIASEYTPEEALDIYKKMASTLSNHGINLNFGPCIDVNPVSNKCPVIGQLDRSFSSDPNIVSNYAAKFIEAHQAKGILTSLKHFPGHGFAQSDTHKDLTDTTNVANLDIELMPYKQLIAQKKLISNCSIMTAHIVNKNLDNSMLPATMSKSVVNDLLRKHMNYDGVIITDALEMSSIKNHYKIDDILIKSINAGVDMLLFARNKAASLNSEETDSWNTKTEELINLISNATNQGLIPTNRIAESNKRLSKYIS